MSKLKKFYENNRIYCILMLVSILCILIILFSLVFYFVKQTSTSPYGNRLDEVSNHPIETEINSGADFLKSSSSVRNSNVRLQGRIVYVDLEMDPKASNDDINSLCSEFLTKFNDDQKSFYDFQFVVSREGMNTYLGSKNSSQTTISWGNFSYEMETTTVASE